MQSLSGTDAGLLAAETSTWPMHVGVVGVFDPRTAPPGLGLGRLGQLIELRLALLGLFRHRVVEVPGRIGRPVWIDVPDLDVADHIRRTEVAAPGGERELGDTVGDMFSERLDRSHPLWQLWHVEGLSDGMEALIFKVHHAATDAARGVELYDVIFDLEADAPLERPGLRTFEEATRPSITAFVRHAGVSLATTPSRFARAASDVARAVPGLARFAFSPERGNAVFPFEAPRGPFNGLLTSRRAFAFCSVPLADVRTVKRAYDVTVNDVVLAMCSGALRRYLQLHDEVPDRSLVAQVPIALYGDETGRDVGAMPGNFLSAMGAALPVHLDGPGDRLRAVHASTRAAKHLQAALGQDLLAHLVDVVPPPIIAALVGVYTKLHLETLHPPIFNAIVSNVAGPPVPVYSCGARLLHTYPLGPLLAGSGLNITVMSYAGSLDVGVTVCPDIVDDPWRIADAIPGALAELLESAEHP